MKIYRFLESIVLKFINLVWYCFVSLHEKSNIKSKKALYGKCEITKEQKEQIDEFYVKHYGKKIPYKWHLLYQSYTGKFDYRYIPEYLFTTKMEPLNNKRLNVLPLENKSLLSNFVNGMGDRVRIPKTYVMCVDNRFYDGKLTPISKRDAIDILKELYGGTYDAICKKTVDTSSGRDVRLIKIKNGVDQLQNDSLEDIVKSMGNNFIIQEKIIAHPTFSALYEKSINTLRVITYQTSTAYKVAPLIMRIGKDGYVDNAHAGGMFIGVTDNGVLLKEAFTEYQQRYLKHPVSGIEFEGYELPKIPEIIEAAIEMHKNYPTLRFISWDFTIDYNGDIVLIEANLHSQAVWVSQIAHGVGFFQDDTAEMLHLIRKNN